MIRAALSALRDAEKSDSVMELLRDVVPDEILRPHRVEKSRKRGEQRRETVLSEFFAPKRGGRGHSR